MFEELKKNLAHEKSIVMDMKSIAAGYVDDVSNKGVYLAAFTSLAEQLEMLNRVVPDLLKEEGSFFDKADDELLDKAALKSVVKKDVAQASKNASSKAVSSNPLIFRPKVSPLVKTASKKAGAKDVVSKAQFPKSVNVVSKVSKPLVSSDKVVRMSYVSPSTKEKKLVTISKEDRANFLKKLKMSEESLASIKGEKEAAVGGVRKANPYAVFSSKYFIKYSDSLSRKFDDLGKDLKNANISILLSAYLAMAMMSCVIAFGVGLLFFVLLLIFSLSNWIFFVLPFGFVGLVMAGFYLYPSSEASSVQKNITYELPFSTIHMAAIAGSNITPIKIFKIIAASPEYPNIGAEMKKVIVQIDYYGYDIVTSLKNVASRSSNKKLSELFSGLATNISSGGALKNYLEKKSESFLVDYRLERQEYSALAGTFMDVYISILIAAPLVLMMMFIVMNVAGLGMGGLSITSLMMLAIAGIVVTNIVFIIVLNMKQPRV